MPTPIVPSPTFSDLAEHTGTLVTLICALIAFCALLLGVISRTMNKIAFTLKDDILKMIKGLDDKIEGRSKEIWEAIEVIRDNQATLRENLPKEYLRIEGIGYKTLTDTMSDIKHHIEDFINDCRTGKCGAKK